MDYFSDCGSNSLWNSDANNVESTDSTSAPELQTAALNRLIEDKEIAAQAVTIVIRSSQRGVVALCAKMAELLKKNRSLTRQVDRLTAENKALRSPSSTSSQPDVSSKSDRSGSGCTSGYHSRTTVAEVHRPPDRTLSNSAFLDMPVKAERRRHRSMQCSLAPESCAVEKEVSGLREDVRRALTSNAAIVDELVMCRRELSALQSSEATCCEPCAIHPSAQRPASVPLQPSRRLSPAISPRRVSFLGCACRLCFALRRQGYPRRLLQLSLLRTNQSLRIKDVVRLSDGRRGRVRYLGHVDTDPAMDSTAIWIGVELDEALASGGGDGKIGHKRYFSGRPGSCLFVELPAIVNVERHRTASSTVYVSDFI